MTSITRSTIAGFTLLELLVVLAIVGIVAGFGTPAITGWLTAERIKSQTFLLLNDLQHARQNAVLRNETVVVCPSADGLDCTRSLDWTTGWIAFVNLDGDNPAVRDHNERIISKRVGRTSVALHSNRFAFRFNGHLARTTNGYISACDPHARATSRRLVVSFTGRTRLDPTSNSAVSRGCPA